jgi:hypothetical protein
LSDASSSLLLGEPTPARGLQFWLALDARSNRQRFLADHLRSNESSIVSPAIAHETDWQRQVLASSGYLEPEQDVPSCWLDCEPLQLPAYKPSSREGNLVGSASDQQETTSKWSAELSRRFKLERAWVICSTENHPTPIAVPEVELKLRSELR